uniref:Uncharacterized protein n=1 Tax=Strigamia maritima TaxID=126957 RepID=T1J9I0_STRMM
MMENGTESRSVSTESQSFLADLEKAKALSLESLELDRLKREKYSGAIPKSSVTLLSSARNNARPRPGTSKSIPPPPVDRNISAESADLINFSPIEKKQKDQDFLKDVELDFFVTDFKSPLPGNVVTWPSSQVPIKVPFVASPSRVCLNFIEDRGPVVPPKEFTDGARCVTPSTPTSDVFKCVVKKRNSNLIDLSADLVDLAGEGVAVEGVDVLTAFDPLLSALDAKSAKANPAAAFEDDFDPSTMLPDEEQPPALPPRCPKEIKSDTVVPLRAKTSSIGSRSQRLAQFVDMHIVRPAHWAAKAKRNYENITVIKKQCDPTSELEAFANMVNSLRREFTHDDFHTNLGLVLSPTLESQREEAMSVKLLISSAYSDKPILFTCDVTTCVEHVISHAVCTMFDEEGSDMMFDEYVLKVHGLAEYFSRDSALVDYEYIHRCQKYDQDVRLTLVHTSELDRPLARTVYDDKSDAELNADELARSAAGLPVTRETLTILLETFESEVEKMREQALKLNSGLIQPKGVIQAVKAICAILSQVEICEVTSAVESLSQVCSSFIMSEESNVADTGSSFTVVQLTRQMSTNSKLDLVEEALHHLNFAIRDLLSLFCRSFRVDFDVFDTSVPTKSEEDPRDISSLMDSLIVDIAAVHRIDLRWATSYDQFVVTCDVYYGSHLVIGGTETKPVGVSSSFYELLLFNQWLQLELMLCQLARESRLVFTLHGIKFLPMDSKNSDGNAVTRTVLGWSSLQLFHFNDLIRQGNFLLGLWPEELDKTISPAAQNLDPYCPIIEIKLPEFECKISFPSVTKTNPYRCLNFEHLDEATQHQLLELINRPSWVNCTDEDREFLWERRHALYDIPAALPRVILAAHSWNWSSLSDIYSMLKEWTPMSPIDALVFPDVNVRRVAISWVKELGSDELCDFLPQLVQAVKFDTWHNSATAKFLLERSLTSIRVAHHLYWLLKQNLDDPLSGPRIQLLLNALLSIAGRAMRSRFEGQEDLMKDLSLVADKIKGIKDSLRLTTLLHEMESVHYSIDNKHTSLPLSPSLEVVGVEVKLCSYFTSNTLPLKISFRSAEPGSRPIEVIFKVGDDLRQDMLTLQLIRIMDKLWLKEGLDLRIVTFACVATGIRKGIVEMVTESETLRKIQTEHGLTGSFKDRPIAEWLQKHNPSELEYQLAMENFTLSCAGYSVATYVLGICDRHNDNIMLKTSGHLFHIDFGKFLGDSQMFGAIKRDRVPFVLTSDMVYVINGGDKPSSRFQQFVDLCCQAFNIVRKNANLFLHLFALMSSAGITGVSAASVSYVHRALLADVSDVEATASFARMIEESLKSWSTQFNFFIHNLAQLRFTGDHEDASMLTFIPKTYTMETDGKIVHIEVYGCQKRYEPEKYYLYVLLVERETDPTPSFLFRSYREFWEFQQKLCLRFPLAKYHCLPRVTHLGRSHVRQVAEKRKTEIESFLRTLWTMADEIKHCNLVYTFFHPLLRDQQDTNCHLLKFKEPKRPQQRTEAHVRGQVKLSIRYRCNSLFIMVMHARNLTSSKNTGPDVYVKTYLLPDMHKITKRKTKMVRRTTHPTFMEMLQYQMSLSIVRDRVLQVSVWDYDRMGENTFLGGVRISLSELDLLKENVSWHSLIMCGPRAKDMEAMF